MFSDFSERCTNLGDGRIIRSVGEIPGERQANLFASRFRDGQLAAVTSMREWPE